MKLKAIIAFALILLVSAVGSANAALVTNTNPANATAAFLFLDTNTATSYTIDTGISLDSLYTSGSSASTGFDINLSSAISALGGPSDLTGFAWSFVGGVVGTGTSGYSQNNLGGFVAGYQSTPTSLPFPVFTDTNTSVDTLTTLFGGSTNPNGSGTAASGELGAFDGAAWANGTFGGSISDIAATTGSMLTLFGYSDIFDGTAVTAELVELGTLTLDAVSGQLTYAPVPLPAAVWFLGSALIGLLGFSRRSAQVAA